MANSQEWFTNYDVIELAIHILGRIDLDPFANTERTVPAASHYVGDEWADGFTLPWGEGGDYTVFVNAPWRQLDDAVDKMLREYHAHRFSEALFLCPNRTERPWHQRLTAEYFPRLEPNKRYWYLKRSDDGLVPEKQIAHASHLFYIGRNVRGFLNKCEGHGVVVGCLS